MKSQNPKLLALIILSLLITACGNVGAGTPPAPTNTPRPAPVLVLPSETPTVALEVTTAPPTFTPTNTPTITATPNPRTPTSRPTLTPRPTSSPTPNLQVTPTPSAIPNLSPTAIVIAPPNRTPTTRPNRAIGGDLLTIRGQDPSGLHLYGTADAVAREYRPLLWDAKLLKRNDRTLEWQPNAASAFKYDEASRSVQIVLRSDIYWSDGTPISTTDFVWTYQQISDPGKNWSDWGFYADKIESYTAPEADKLVIKLRGEFSNAFELANLVEPLPRHIWENKSWSNPGLNAEIYKPTVTSGPWKLKEWQPGKFITFVRNPASTIAPVPYINSLTFQLGGQKEALEMLARGEIDFYSPPAAQYQTLRQMAKVVTYRWNSANPTWHYLGLNFRRPLWQDITLRRAIAAVTDRDEIIKDAAGGLGAPQYSDISPGHPAYHAEVEKIAFDVENARQELTKVGYSLYNNKLLDKNGQEIPALTLLYSPDEPRPKLAAYFQKQLALIGLTVKLVPLEYRTYQERLQTAPYDFDLFLGSWKAPSLNVELLSTIWENNFQGYVNNNLTALYKRAITPGNDLIRNYSLQQIQELEAKELPYLYLYAEQDFIGVGLNLGGVTAGPLGVLANRYTDWYIKP